MKPPFTSIMFAVECYSKYLRRDNMEQDAYETLPLILGALYEIV